MHVCQDTCTHGCVYLFTFGVRIYLYNVSDSTVSMYIGIYVYKYACMSRHMHAAHIHTPPQKARTHAAKFCLTSPSTQLCSPSLSSTFTPLPSTESLALLQSFMQASDCLAVGVLGLGCKHGFTFLTCMCISPSRQGRSSTKPLSQPHRSSTKPLAGCSYSSMKSLIAATGSGAP